MSQSKRKEKEMEAMGMTDKQFNGFLRMLLNNLEEAKREASEEKKVDKLQVVIDDIKRTVED